ncbi:MAG TPA: hypothetical protein VE871_01875 [Longimicrobium sp.]|nr:hypothetical protein [Longimicrobium sp.]
MKKISLNVETLSVESFDVSGAMEQARGTVQANDGSLNDHCYSHVGSCNRTACCPDTTFC